MARINEQEREKAERMEPRSVTMHPEDWAIVDELATALDGNTSAAMRWIVRQWATQRQELSATPIPARAG